MRPRGKNPATYADLEALPSNLVGEIIDGELVASPRPTIPHTVAASTLGAELLMTFQRRRGTADGWWIMYEPELHLGPDVLVPDVAGWRRTVLEIPEPVAYMTLAPSWVCEVLSPSTAINDQVRKKRIYARAGVEFIWFVDPIARRLEVYRLRDGDWIACGAFSGEDRVRAEPFAELELELGILWIPQASDGRSTPEANE